MDFHHLGVACEDLEREASVWRGLGYVSEGEVFHDPVQGISGLFLTGAGPRLELVAPLDGGSTVLGNILAQRLKLYHLAYFTADLAEDLAGLRAKRGKLVVPPSPAVAFGLRNIAFVALPNRVLIELIEAA